MLVVPLIKFNDTELSILMDELLLGTFCGTDVAVQRLL